MRPGHLLLLALTAVFAVAAASGCGGGSKSQSVSTPWRGSISGVTTRPADGITDIAADTWIEVSWPDQYLEPPSSFTFKLYIRTYDNWEAVKTVDKYAYPETGTWWFAPEHELSYDTEYKIVIRDNYGDSYTSYFVTEWDPSRAPSRARKEAANYKPQGGGKTGGTAKEEHTVDTAR